MAENANGYEERTIERYIEKCSSELIANGYFLCKGKRLKELKLQFAPVINVGSKTTQLGLFNFRSFLNIGMLLVESEKARALRSSILDLVIATINEKTGGGTKFINRRDVNYIPAAITEENYRKELTSAMSQCVNGNKRIALTLGAYFLYKNAYFWQATTFMRQMESIVYHVAASNIGQDLLHRIMTSFMDGTDYDEELKIDIVNAMSKGMLGVEGEDYSDNDGFSKK